MEKFKKPDKWACLNDTDLYELEKHIAPLVTVSDTDEYAKRFDNFMYSMMLANIDKPTSFMKLFDAKTKNALLQTIEIIKNNAIQVVA